MLAVACCRRVSNMLRLTPDPKVASIPPLLFSDFSRRYNCATIFCCVANQLIPSEHHSSSAAVALARAQQNSTLPDHILGGLFRGHRIAWVWLLPSSTSRYSLVKSIYGLPARWNTSTHVSPPAPPPTPTIGSRTRFIPMNSQASEPGYFFLVRTSQADLRDIHVPSSSSPAPPFVEI